MPLDICFVKYSKIRSTIWNYNLKDEDRISDWWKLFEKSLNDKVNWTQHDSVDRGTQWLTTWRLKVLFFEFTKIFLYWKMFLFSLCMSFRLVGLCCDFWNFFSFLEKLSLLVSLKLFFLLQKLWKNMNFVTIGFLKKSTLLNHVASVHEEKKHF